MADYKKQHSVTKAYLRNFTDLTTPTSLLQLSKADGSVRPRNIDKCSVRTYYYSIKQNDGSWNHAAEKLFGLIEDESIPVLNQLLAAGNLDILTDDARWILSRFIAATYRRSPLLIDHFHNSGVGFATDRTFMGSAFDKWINEADQEFAESEIRAARAQYLDNLNESIEELKALQLEKIFEKLDEGTSVFFNMQWRLVKANASHYFITSDAPAYTVSTRWVDSNSSRFVRVGDGDCQFCFPLSRSYFLLARHKNWPEQKQATKMRTRELNATAIRMANKYVFASNLDESVLVLFEQNRRIKPPLPPVKPPKP